MKRSLFFVVCVMCFACGAPSNNVGPSGATPSGPSCGNQNGITTCNDVATCQAGNYCTDAFYVSEKCQPGCTSDANCGSGDYCARCTGEAVGVCQRCGVAAACGTTSGSNCKFDNGATQTCKDEGQGSEGYLCKASSKPVGQCEQSKLVPDIYCCGASSAACSAANDLNFMCNNAWLGTGPGDPPGKPGDYSKASKCTGAATPAGTCKHQIDDLWCCN